MGMNDRQAERTEAKRAEKRQRQLVPQDPISMDDINADTLLYALHNIVSAGGALRIGATRDKGAWAFGIYGDGAKPYTEYVRPAEDINAYLKRLGDFFGGLKTD